MVEYGIVVERLESIASQLKHRVHGVLFRAL